MWLQWEFYCRAVGSGIQSVCNGHNDNCDDNLAQPKILIVDDVPFNVDYLEQELRELNNETVSACNVQEALEKIQTESPDLVLLDIMMPVMDGFAVLVRMRRTQRCAIAPSSSYRR